MNRLRNSLFLVTLWLSVTAAVVGQPAVGQDTAADRQQSHGRLLKRQADARLLNERFQSAQEFYLRERSRTPESLGKLLKEVLGNQNLSPKERQVLDDLVGSLQRGELRLNQNDPLVKKLQALANRQASSPSGLNVDSETINKILQDLAEKKDPAASSPTAGSPPAQPSTEPAEEPNRSETGPGTSPSREPRGGSGPEAPGPKEANTDMAQWLLKNSDWLTKKSGALQESPAWRSALEQLTKYASGGASYRLGVAKESWEEGLARRVESLMPSTSFWNDKVLPRLNRLPLPSLPPIRLPRVDLSRTSLPSVDVPQVGLPSVSGPRSKTGLLVMAAAGVLAFVLWYLYRFWPQRVRRGKLASEGPDARGGELGPWPGTPLAARQDLVRAFEQVSVQKLGPEARNWNHWAIATGLGGGEPVRGQVARHLASLYERARYAPANEPLPDGALQTAQRELSFLAGIAAV